MLAKNFFDITTLPFSPTSWNMTPMMYMNHRLRAHPPRRKIKDRPLHLAPSSFLPGHFRYWKKDDFRAVGWLHPTLLAQLRLRNNTMMIHKRLKQNVRREPLPPNFNTCRKSHIKLYEPITNLTMRGSRASSFHLNFPALYSSYSKLFIAALCGREIYCWRRGSPRWGGGVTSSPRAAL